MSNSILSVQPLGFPWQTKDPFIFCVYHRDEFPKGNAEMGPHSNEFSGRAIGNDFTIKDGWRMYHGSKVPGFPYHPHRGFETITAVKEGIVDHTDSMGASGRFSSGDVQWMTAGRGVLHSEIFPLLHEDKENPMELFQIWLNLPKRSKFVEPHFKMLWKEEIPVVELKDKTGKKTTIDVISGELNNTKGLTPTPDSFAADPENNVGVFTVKIEATAEYTLTKTAEGTNRMLYFYKGDKLLLDGKLLNQHAALEVNEIADITIQAGDEECRLLILQGKPINEPVVQHGPFVMNTQQEIMEAFEEYRKTQFGGWPWPKEEFTHPKNVQRFALHGDGKKEEKDFI